MKKRSPKEKIVRTTVSFPPEVLACIDEIAKLEGMTRTQTIRWLTRRALKRADGATEPGFSAREIQQVRDALGVMDSWFRDRPSPEGEAARKDIQEARDQLPRAMGPDKKPLQ